MDTTRPRSGQVDEARVSGLFSYPIKSARGIELERATLEARGFALDRRWMLVDAEGQFLTQRKHPKLALVGVEVAGGKLVLSGPGRPRLEVPVEQSASQSSAGQLVRVWRSQCRALGVSPHADDWFRELLGLECRLVFMPESTRRRIDPEFGSEDDLVSFADGYPFLLVGQASLDDLNGRLDQPVPMDRFRPNIVVDTREPFVEDTWKRVRIGGAVFRVAKPCARCAITTTDQRTAERHKEPLATLSTYRRSGGDVLFGQYLVHEGLGEICVGDTVELLDAASDGG